MKYFKILLASCLFATVFCAAANAQNLNIGMVPLPCTSYGATASLPITLTNAGGILIAAVSADITFDDTYFEYIDATIGAAGSAASKDVVGTTLAPGQVRIGVLSSANTYVIGNGVVAYVNFKLLKNPVGGINIGITAGASDPAGAPVVITSTTTGGFFTVKTGDTDMDGDVSIAEVLATVSMFLGLATVDPICDVNGDGIVQISDVIKVINCALETATCACDVDSDPREKEEWQGSGHADSGAMAFNDWNEKGHIPYGCVKCHSTPGYVQYVTNPAGTLDNATTGTVITCTACHDSAAEAMTSVIFESSGSTIAPIVTKTTVSNIGSEARCIVCHQGRSSKAAIDGYITTTRAAGLGTGLDVVDAGASTRTSHYMAAGGIQYGTVTKVGYQYTGKIYDAKFAHVDGYDTCITCHDSHSLELKYDKCVTCHTGATTVAAVKNIRMQGSMEDYDGDGNETEGMAAEVDGVKAKLLTAIQQYAVTRTPATPIGYDPTTYSYWKIDTNGDKVIDPATETTNYNAYTARLIKACYNYMLVDKDRGAYAHGGKYAIQIMYDSIEDLNAGILVINPAAVLDVDITKLAREDEGHFNGGSDVFRRWDADADKLVDAGCAKCHTGEGIPFFLTNGLNIAEAPANGMMCVNCHTSVTDTVAPRRVVNNVVFAGNATYPSTLSANFGAADDSNLCLLCHQGRETTISINGKIAADADGVMSFSNVHYYAAAGSLFGTQVKVGYEYAPKVYTGRNPYSSHGGMFNKCVQCHMGSDSVHPDYQSHNVAKPNPNNCICHFGDVSQTPGAFTFDNIRPATGIGSTDYDGDANVTESLRSEIAQLEANLLTEIYAYALNSLIPAGNRAAIVYDAHAYPYWFKDNNVNGIYDTGDTTFSTFDAALLKAAYNYQMSQKDPNGFIHNPLYIAQLLNDSRADLVDTAAGVPGTFVNPAWR